MKKLERGNDTAGLYTVKRCKAAVATTRETLGDKARVERRISTGEEKKHSESEN